MGDVRLSDHRLARLVLTSQRYECLLELHAIATCTAPAEIVHCLDDILAGRHRMRVTLERTKIPRTPPRRCRGKTPSTISCRRGAINP